MESIGTLAGGIAHDFNNILGIILGNAELALDNVPEWNPARLNLKDIRTVCLRAKDVVRQLLSFARKSRLEKKPIDIATIVRESLKLLRSSIPTNIEIRQNISKDIDIIMADPTQLNQVLINLCTNAEHAIPDEGMIEVTLKNLELKEDTAAQYPELNPGRFVTITVSDTGHGISQEEIDEELPSGNEYILLIDDDEFLVQLGCQRLERLGYKVEATTNPIEALDQFRSKPNKFDLVITDMTMPQITGDKLVKEILNIRSDIPIILCTGFSEKIDEKKAKEIGATDYIEKPVDMLDFAFKVRKVLDVK
jgi:CheY-like chemotaxis protein